MTLMMLVWRLALKEEISVLAGPDRLAVRGVGEAGGLKSLKDFDDAGGETRTKCEPRGEAGPLG
jgi:hypothetical protein